MNAWSSAYRRACRNARLWAREGNVYMAQNFLDQAANCGYVSPQRVAALNKLLRLARERQVRT